MPDDNARMDHAALVRFQESLRREAEEALRPPSRTDRLQARTTTVEVTVKETLTGEDVSDLLASAFEGGSTYWISSVVVWNDDYRGGEFASEALALGAILGIQLHEGQPADEDDDDFKIFALDFDSTVKGIVKAAEHLGKSVRGMLDDYDAFDADLALQYALFDEVIFG